MELSPEVLEIARKELNEDPDTREEFLTALKVWLDKTPHLQAKTDDAFLLSVLRGTKFSIERAKQKLDSFYTYRTHLIDVFGNWDPFTNDVQSVMDLSVMALFKPPKSTSRWTLVNRFCPEEASRITANDLLKVSSMMMDIALKEYPEMAVVGWDFVLCGENFGASHALMWTPPMLKRGVKVIQDCYGLRVGSINIINSTKAMVTIGELFKSFLSDKLKKRTQIFEKGSPDCKLEHLQENLPEECGGTNGKFQDHVDYWKNKLESYKDWFAEQEKYRCIEELRPGKPLTYGDLFGMEGSFRKLAVD